MTAETSLVTLKDRSGKSLQVSEDVLDGLDSDGVLNFDIDKPKKCYTIRSEDWFAVAERLIQELRDYNVAEYEEAR